jgi:hypothetical protein
MLKFAVILTRRYKSGYVLCPFPRQDAVVTAVYTHTAHHSNNAHTVFFCVFLLTLLCTVRIVCSKCSAATWKIFSIGAHWRKISHPLYIPSCIIIFYLFRRGLYVVYLHLTITQRQQQTPLPKWYEYDHKQPDTSKEQIKTIVPPNEYPYQTSNHPRVYNLQQAPPLPKTSPRYSSTDIKSPRPILKENFRSSTPTANLSTHFNLNDILKISSPTDWDLNPHTHRKVNNIYILVKKHSLRMKTWKSERAVHFWSTAT